MISIKDLTDKLSDYHEDVMVIAYGDHLPGMNLESKDLKTIPNMRHHILSGITLDITKRIKRSSPGK